MDPRVQTTTAQLQEQFNLSVICYNARKSAADALAKISTIEKQIPQIKASAPVKFLEDFKTKLSELKGGRRDANVSWTNLANSSDQLFGILQGTDMPVTSQAKQAVTDLDLVVKKVSEAWTTFLTVDLPAFNKTLKSKSVKPITY